MKKPAPKTTENRKLQKLLAELQDKTIVAFMLGDLIPNPSRPDAASLADLQTARDAFHKAMQE